MKVNTNVRSIEQSFKQSNHFLEYASIELIELMNKIRDCLYNVFCTLASTIVLLLHHDLYFEHQNYVIT